MKVYFEGNVINLPEGTTVEEARNTLADIFPNVATAHAEETDEGVRFTAQSGTKGADLDPSEPVKVIYGDNVLNLPAGTTPEEARDVLSTIQPEVASATVTVNEGNVLRFEVQSGTKGN